jgi:hypothetical protein
MMMVYGGLEATVQGYIYKLNNIGASTTTEQFACTWATRQGKWKHMQCSVDALLGLLEKSRERRGAWLVAANASVSSGPLRIVSTVLNANVGVRKGQTPRHQHVQMIGSTVKQKVAYMRWGNTRMA